MILTTLLLLGYIDEAPAPTSESTPDQPSITDILVSMKDLSIDEFFEESFRQLQLRYPDTLISNGLADKYGVEKNNQFTNISDHYIRETQHLESGILDLLQRYDYDALSSQQQLSYDIYEYYLDDLVHRQEFMYYSYPINSVGNWDTQYWLINSMFNSLPIRTLQDAEDYIVRLSQINSWIKQLLEGLNLREQAGVIPPKFLLQRSINFTDKLIQKQGNGSFDVQAIHLYTFFREKLAQVEISDAQKQNLLDAALTEIEDTVNPAFFKLKDYLIYLESIASDTPGVCTFPQGDAFYNYILRHWTGTDLSPDQVHDLGLAEVVRIQAEIRAAVAEMGYPDISMAELNQLLSTESVLQGDALKKEYERLISQADQAMEGFFDMRPSAEVVIRYDPDAPPAYYQQPPFNGSGPGQMVANLANSAQFIFYNPAVLVHHETIPGHHVQIALAQELGLPTTFRRDIIFNVYRQHLPFQAYKEGWALYAEVLAWEMGLYEDDPLSNLGRLRLQLHRTARLVIDTGIHAKCWTLHEALDYLKEATGSLYNQDQLAQIIAIPGQACGYTIGFLKILELRQRAMDRLRDKFDIKVFHNVILGHGPMPLEILERIVDTWIEVNLSE